MNEGVEKISFDLEERFYFAHGLKIGELARQHDGQSVGFSSPSKREYHGAVNVLVPSSRKQDFMKAAHEVIENKGYSPLHLQSGDDAFKLGQELTLMSVKNIVEIKRNYREFRKGIEEKLANQL